MTCSRPTRFHKGAATDGSRSKEAATDDNRSQVAATDEEEESALGAETDPEPAADEAARITPPPEPDPVSQAAGANPQAGVVPGDPSHQVATSGQDGACRLRSARAHKRPSRYLDPDIYKY